MVHEVTRSDPIHSPSNKQTGKINHTIAEEAATGEREKSKSKRSRLIALTFVW